MAGKVKFFTTEYPEIKFEDSRVGRLKKRIWEASDAEIDAILEDYGIPSPSELGVAGTYIQNTPRHIVCEKRKKNDVVLIPIGCTENHGLHNNSGLDTFMVTQIIEGVRRKTAKDGKEVALAFTPLNYGGHPYHHIGMPGTVIMPEEVVKETLIYTMLGMWDDGFRKMILVNNHGHLWMLESAVQEFFKRYQLPAFVTVLEWHRAVREFFYPVDGNDKFETCFIHADEAETAVALLMFKDMIDMSVVQDAWGHGWLGSSRYDVSVDSYGRPHRWSEAEGHNAIERFGTPEGVVGTPSVATAAKAKRPIAAILEYLTDFVYEILDAYPPGKTPPVEEFTFRTEEEMAPYLKEPLSEGWKSVHEMPKLGIFSKL
jgi:creatinine amidohydrolase/Fe(II)-dependent formamide hydrolase-like protein